MNVDLPNDVNEFVKHLVVSGRFQSEQEAVTEGLRLLQARETLRRDVQKGFDQLDAGEGIEADVVFQEVNQVIDAVEKEQLGS